MVVTIVVTMVVTMVTSYHGSLTTIHRSDVVK